MRTVVWRVWINENQVCSSEPPLKSSLFLSLSLSCTVSLLTSFSLLYTVSTYFFLSSTFFSLSCTVSLHISLPLSLLYRVSTYIFFPLSLSLSHLFLSFSLAPCVYSHLVRVSEPPASALFVQHKEGERKEERVRQEDKRTTRCRDRPTDRRESAQSETKPVVRARFRVSPSVHSFLPPLPFCFCSKLFP